MIIIVGGEPDMHGLLSKRVGSMHACKHYVWASPVQNAVCMTCCALCRSVKKGLCKVTGEITDVHESQGWRHRQGSASMKRFAGFSLIPALQFVVRVSQLSLSHCQHARSYSYHHYALHCSPPRAHTSASVAWPYMSCQRGHVQRSPGSREWDEHGRSVG